MPNPNTPHPAPAALPHTAAFVVTHLYVDSGYRAEHPTLEAARADAKRSGFSARVTRGGKLVATWCPLVGWQSMRSAS